MAPRGKCYNTSSLKQRMSGRWLQYYSEEILELSEAAQRCNHHVPCPIHGGRDGFKLFKDADRTGGGICNTCGGNNDGIGLLMSVMGWSFHETVETLEEWLSGQDGDNDNAGWLKSPVLNEKSSAPPLIDQWAAYNIARICDKAIVGHERLTRYYRHRGLLIRPSNSLGIILDDRYRDDWEDMNLPVMVGLFHHIDGTAVGALRTYLDPDGDGKADVESPKKFTRALYPGALRGAAIQLRPYDRVLAVGEGIETCESIFQSTRVAAWATGSAGGLESFIPPDDIREIHIWADNDSHGVGQQAAEKLADRLLASGIPVRILLPLAVDTDWLDVLNYCGERTLRMALSESRLFMPQVNGRCL